MTDFDQLLTSEISLVENQPKKSRTDLEAEGWQFTETCQKCGKLFTAHSNQDTGTDPHLCVRCFSDNVPAF